MEFVDERGLRWGLSEFCTHYRLDKDAAMKLFGELDHPARLDTRDFVQSCNPKMKILRRVILILPGGEEKRVFPSTAIMFRFAEEYAEKNLPIGRRRKARSYLAAWSRMGRQYEVNLEVLLEEAIAPKMKTAMGKTTAAPAKKKLTGIPAKLAAIPGPTRYERQYFDDAGDFGAQTIQRSNFAGRTKGGGPIYTGR